MTSRNIETISRAQVFKQKPILRAHIRDFQEHFFDHEYNNYNDPIYDALAYDAQELHYESTIVMWPHNNINQYVGDLAEELRGSLASLGCTGLVLMPLLGMDWFARVGLTDKELVRVRATLQQIVDSPSYTEALSIPLSEVESMIDIVFWSARLDPDFPEYLFWMDIQERFCFFVCRYGNIHILTFNAEFRIPEQVWKDRGWNVGMDVDQFG